MLSAKKGQGYTNKKKFYKKKKYGMKKGGYKRSFQQNPRIDDRLKLPLPQTYQTTLSCTCAGIIPTAGIAAPGLLLFVVKGNDLHLPFSLGNWAVAGAFTLAKGTSTLTVGTLAPAGYGNFLGSTVSGFYQYTRVLASSIKVCITPNNIGDAVSVCIVPILQGAAVLPTSVIASTSQPFASKIIQCTSNQTPKLNTIKNYITTAQIFGVNKKVILAEDAYKGAANGDPASIFEWYIVIQTNDSAASAANIDINCEIKYYVQFEASTGAGLRDTEN